MSKPETFGIFVFTFVSCHSDKTHIRNTVHEIYKKESDAGFLYLEKLSKTLLSKTTRSTKSFEINTLITSDV
jgi:hypothetical protein